MSKKLIFITFVITMYVTVKASGEITPDTNSATSMTASIDSSYTTARNSSVISSPITVSLLREIPNNKSKLTSSLNKFSKKNKQSSNTSSYDTVTVMRTDITEDRNITTIEKVIIPHDKETVVPDLQEMRHQQSNLSRYLPTQEKEKFDQLITMRERLIHGNQHCVRLCDISHNDNTDSHCHHCSKSHCSICAKHPSESNLRTIISVFLKKYKQSFPECFNK